MIERKGKTMKKSIFVKIFFGFWLLSILMILIHISFDTYFGSGLAEFINEGESVFSTYAGIVAELYAHGEASKMDNILKDIKMKSGINAFILDRSFNEFKGRPFPEIAISQSRELLKKGKTALAVEGNSEIRAYGPAVGEWGEFFVILVSDINLLGPHFGSARQIFLRLILILTISGMVCYGFARYITAPIIILKDASKKFAAGAFDVRTAACVGAQNGEISELAEALDCMAERIETDMNFQRQMIGELAKKNKSLIELNATRERFFGILAHDLKGSLGGLITITQMLTSDYDNIAEKNKKEYLIIARDNAENVYHLLENLLKWLMCQTEVLQPVHVMANLNSSIEKTIDLFRTDAGNKKISIETYYEGPETIEIDLNIFSTILRNLISNSIKFTRPGGKVIVRTERQNDLVRVSVQDDGVGIKLKTVETIFRVEKRVSTSGTFGETGTGIGLILCHELVKKLGGDLKIDSVENSGTTFLFDLPVTRTVTGGA